MVPRGAYQWRVGAYLTTESSRSYGSAASGTAPVGMLPQRLAHQVLLRMEAAGDSPDDRVQDAVARSEPVKAYADALWPALDSNQSSSALLLWPRLIVLLPPDTHTCSE